MKIHIVSNGNARSTRITDAETGEDLSGHLLVTEIHIDARDTFPHAILTCAMPPVDLIADAEIKRICPCCGRPVDEGGNPA
jgi:hypothetical protein